MDFLNSTATPARETVELIGDGRSYLTWLELAGFIGPADQDAAVTAFGPAELDAVAAEAVRLREWLRPLVAAWAVADRPVLPEAARHHLNQILAGGHRSLRIETGDDGAPQVHERRSWEDPRQLLAPPAEAAARLFATGDRQLVRPCAGPTCTLWFYDRTRSHRRRWCSMAACGNREKARQHRQRDRTGTS